MKPLSRRIVDENPIDPCAALMYHIDRLDASNTAAQKRMSELMAEYDELYSLCLDMERLLASLWQEDSATHSVLLELLLRSGKLLRQE
jgi:hypothetical protein